MQGVLTLPNVISIVRLLLIPLFLWLVFGVDEVGWAGLLLAVIGATDWIDGYVARRFDQVSELGKFLDPLADRVAVAVAVIAGLAAGIMNPWFGWAIIVREGIVGVGALYGWTQGVTRLDVRWMGKAATFGLYTSVAAVYVGVGFAVTWLTVMAYGIGVPSLIVYYVVGFQYAADMKAEIARAKAGGGDG